MTAAGRASSPKLRTTNGNPKLPALANITGGQRLRGSIQINFESNSAINPESRITNVIANAKLLNSPETPPRSINTLNSRQGIKISIFIRFGSDMCGLYLLAYASPNATIAKIGNVISRILTAIIVGF